MKESSKQFKAKFLVAAESADLDAINDLLRKGVDPNLTDDDRYTALMKASESKMDSAPDVVKCLLAAGASLESKSDNLEMTAIFFAASNNSLAGAKILGLLVAAGADVNVIDAWGHTAVWWAARDCIMNAGILLRSGALINRSAHSGEITALMAMAFSREVETLAADRDLVDLMIEQGVEINVVDTSGETPLMYWLKSGRESAFGVVQLLLSAGADALYVSQNRGYSTLMAAAGSGSSQAPEMVGELLARGVDPSARDDCGETALMYAAKSCGDKSPDVARLLIEHGVDSLVSDFRGKTAMMYAVSNREEISAIAILRLLLKSGSDCNAADANGRTVLMHALQEKSGLPLIEVLLDAGADIKAVDSGGDSAVFYAVRNMHEESVSVLRALIDRGANLFQKNNMDETPLDVVLESDSYFANEVEDFLRSAGAVSGVGADALVEIGPFDDDEEGHELQFTSDCTIVGWEKISKKRYEELLERGSYDGEAWTGQLEGMLYNRSLALDLDGDRIKRSRQFLGRLYAEAKARALKLAKRRRGGRRVKVEDQYFVVWRHVYDAAFMLGFVGGLDPSKFEFEVEFTNVPGEGEIETVSLIYDGDQFGSEDSGSVPDIWLLAADGTKTELVGGRAESDDEEDE